MANLPLPSELCKPVDLDLDAIFGMAIQLPGPVNLQPHFNAGEMPDLGAAVARILGELNASLAPLVPVFRLIQIALALYDCMKALPDALGPPPDPSKLSKCIEKLAKVIGFAANMAPQLSVPVMVKTNIDVITAGLENLKAQIDALTTVKLGIDATADLAQDMLLDPDLAFGAASLQVSIDCANANFEIQKECLLRGACPLNSLLGILSIFLSMIGKDPIPELTLSADLSAAKDAIDALIALLKQLKLTLPGLVVVEGC